MAVSGVGKVVYGDLKLMTMLKLLSSSATAFSKLLHSLVKYTALAK